jgi:integration host factor subunit alpha
MSLTKEEIINDIYNQVGLSKTMSRSVVESLFEIVKTTLERGESVLISRFGRFTVKEKGERRGRNPQTSQEIRLRPRKVVLFRSSGVLKKRINSRTKASE